MAKDCQFVGEYLVSSGNLEKWRCARCPEGAFCDGKATTWDKVKPLFGRWRNSLWSEDFASNFTRCAYPPACLGAKNPKYKGRYLMPDGSDPSDTDSNETCNEKIGYAVSCTREETSRCRLCGTCKPGYRRRQSGSATRCDKCPEGSANKVLMAGGVLLAMFMLSVLLVHHIKRGGKRTVMSMQKVVVINYFQLRVVLVSIINSNQIFFQDSLYCLDQ